jgi:Predicted membrane protein
MVFALAVGQLGVALFLLPALGADPYTVYCQGLATVFGVSIGMANLAFSLLVLAVFLFATKGYVLPGTVVCSFFAGPFIDLYYWLLNGSITPEAPVWLRLASALVGTMFIAFCFALLIKADGGMGAADLIPVFISDRFRLQYRWAKMGCDLILVITGVCLGGVIGVGTVVAVLLVGPVAQLFFAAMGWLVDWIVRKIPA